MTYNLNPNAISISGQRRIILNYPGKCIDVYENKMPVEMKPFWEKVASIISFSNEAEWFDINELSEDNFCAVGYFWQDLRSDETTHCQITNEDLPDDQVAITEIGPVATRLWEGKEIEFDGQGLAILPDRLKKLYAENIK